ncbi:MAG: TetR/AcrR family transcriptional regulator [Methanobrevibacter sp.]|uniref:TetR/AcrR family transcriptional regulator n=1 Tax=Methanobrevibacter sp. TaxID=66852 RepID=UPI0025E698CE|nr:TetR/AcrR family transcriptional regulator [Methanobrevibacter sp.]MBQ8017346.1 TetR/AcrR family transcriptional regulator [Methanobrevibacter sp.]
MEVKSGSIEERIINASFHILEKEGISGATTKKIATQAEVSEVTLFRKFENKQKLIEAAKDYYCNNLISKLEEIFESTPETSVEEYLTSCFYKVANLTDYELNIIKVGLEEVRNIPTENKVFLRISETIILKLKNFFSLKIQQNEIRKINPEILALNMFSILFESIILWKVYGKTPQYPIDKYIEDFLDIILNGIKSDIK